MTRDVLAVGALHLVLLFCEVLNFCSVCAGDWTCPCVVATNDPREKWAVGEAVVTDGVKSLIGLHVRCPLGQSMIVRIIIQMVV